MANDSSGDCPTCQGSGRIEDRGPDAFSEGCNDCEGTGIAPVVCDNCGDEHQDCTDPARPAMVASYDERPFDGDLDFADLDGARW